MVKDTININGKMKRSKKKSNMKEAFRKLRIFNYYVRKWEKICEELKIYNKRS